MIRYFRLIESLGMAVVAIGGESEAIELPYRSHLVAGIAVHHGMGPDQGKAVLVLVDVVDGDLPAIGVVAQLALGAILAAMQIGMAILALVGSVGEIEIGVTVTAGDRGMPAAERKSRLGVIEFDLALDDLPVRGGVAGNARHVEVAMRALRRGDRPR